MKKTGLCTCLFGLLALLFTAAAVGVVIHFRDAGPVLLDVPQEASARVEQLMEAVCAGDFQEAETMLWGTTDLGTESLPEDSIMAMIWQAYLDTLDYRLMGEI